MHGPVPLEMCVVLTAWPRIPLRASLGGLLDRLAVPFDVVEALLVRFFTRPLSHVGRRLDALAPRLAGTRLRKAISVGLFPLMLVLTLVAGFALVEGGVTALSFAGILLLYAVYGLVLAPLERLMPFSRKWTEGPDDAGTDLMLLFGSKLWRMFVSGPLQLVTIMLVVEHVAPFGRAIWPGHLWPVAQVFLLLLAQDFLRYWYHRWLHEWPLFWRWHAVHHAPARLYWFNATRIHPLEGMISTLMLGIPAALLQAPIEIVLVGAMVGRLIGCFHHSNIDLSFGPLDYVISSPANHRLHHSKILAQGNSNYGGDFIVWDILFGTFCNPRRNRPSDDIGLADMPNFPRSYFGLMLAPFIWDRDRWSRPPGQGSDDRL